MTPDQRRQYGAIYPRLMELADKQERGQISDDELREQQELADDLELLMNQMSPHPPIDQN